MKSIIQSIKPQYCELIAKGKKTIEVRKTRPKLDVPFKVYIYMTKSNLVGDRKAYKDRLAGKVIGEYVCDKIIEYPAFQQMDAYIIPFLQQSLICLTQEELWQYGKGKTLYGWHISDLKIYDKPKELSEFHKPCINPGMRICELCEFADFENTDVLFLRCINVLTHPPQSWCYVEEVTK